jgi:hypothetical protein
VYANARNVLDDPRTDLDQVLAYRCELSVGQRAGLRDGSPHAMHQPERGGMEDEPHLIGGRAMARHAVRGELCLVQLDQVLRLPTRKIKCLMIQSLARSAGGQRQNRLRPIFDIIFLKAVRFQ